MNVFAKCPKCGVQMLVDAVICARCSRTVQPGQYLIAPPGSQFVGLAICFQCLDGEARARAPKRAGPAETKAA